MVQAFRCLERATKPYRFNLVLEATADDIAGVKVSLDELTGPSDAKVTTRAAASNEVFDYTGRNIELF